MLHMMASCHSCSVCLLSYNSKVMLIPSRGRHGFGAISALENFLGKVPSQNPIVSGLQIASTGISYGKNVFKKKCKGF